MRPRSPRAGVRRQGRPRPGTAPSHACTVRPRIASGCGSRRTAVAARVRSEEHTSELQSLMRISYAVFCLKKKKINNYKKKLDTVPEHSIQPNKDLYTSSIRRHIRKTNYSNQVNTHNHN